MAKTTSVKPSPTEAPELVMVQVRLEQKMLLSMAMRHRCPLQVEDIGYWSHLALQGLWGDVAPAPFRVLPSQNGAWFTILGYMEKKHAENLVENGQLNAPPDLASGIDWSELKSKTMPKFRAGQVLNFDLFACPVKRCGDRHHTRRPGAEVDAFLFYKDQGSTLSREEIYQQWLESKFVDRGAKILSISSIQTQLKRCIRRTHADERQARRMLIPGTTWQGTLQVDDPVLFGHLVAGGIGRHKGFGFGMMMLKTSQF